MKTSAGATRRLATTCRSWRLFVSLVSPYWVCIELAASIKLPWQRGALSRIADLPQGLRESPCPAVPRRRLLCLSVGFPVALIIMCTIILVCVDDAPAPAAVRSTIRRHMTASEKIV